MANPEHLAILKQGRFKWNEWRRQHPKVTPLLQGAFIAGLRLRKVNLNEAQLDGADLSKCDLRDAKLGKASLLNANVMNAQLEEADLHDSNLSGSDFTQAVLDRAGLQHAICTNTTFRRSQLTGAHLNDTDLTSADLRGADCRTANFTDSLLTKATLHSAILNRTTFSGADLTDSDLGNADLRLSNLMQAVMVNCDLRKADLSGSNICGADLSDSHVGWTQFGNLDLTTTLGLGSLKHSGPSSIAVDTLYTSGACIPEVFLRGVGVPDNLITFLTSLISHPIQFYSCFISYSTVDAALAERLYADLQAAGVRCWFAPEDLKIGDPFRQRIDEAIRIHETLLVILSKHSVISSWVEDEVESAIERETQDRRLVLFPIRVDEGVMVSEKAWAAKIRRTRHIGDFSEWKAHDFYQKAFQRLIRDLQHTTPAIG